MNTARTTKLLLGSIAVALWTLVVLLLMAPRAGSAAGEGPNTSPALAIYNGRVYVAADGHTWEFSDTLGQPNYTGSYGPAIQAKH